MVNVRTSETSDYALDQNENAQAINFIEKIRFGNPRNQNVLHLNYAGSFRMRRPFFDALQGVLHDKSDVGEYETDIWLL